MQVAHCLVFGESFGVCAIREKCRQDYVRRVNFPSVRQHAIDIRRVIVFRYVEVQVGEVEWWEIDHGAVEDGGFKHVLAHKFSVGME